METFLTFTLFGSGIAFGVLLVLLLITLIVSDIREEGEIAGTAIVIFLILNYFWGTFPILSLITIKNVIAYILIGFLFSIVRTFFKGKELTEDEKKYFKLKDHVFRWWFLFPFSLINWVFGKLIKDFYNLIYDKFEKFYNEIFNI